MTGTPSVIDADWPAPHGVVAGCTVRTGGVSEGAFAELNLAAHVGDDAGCVTENRRRLAAACHLPAEPAWLRQVHGCGVAVNPSVTDTIEADAAYTSRAGLVCAVLTADCLPVIFATRDGGEVAVAHAGWRGLASGVLEATVAAFRGPASEILAWFGPTISQDAFEVGPEIREAFVDKDRQAASCFAENARGRWQADLYGLARLRLACLGIERIYGGEFCTFGDAERFFSYRRDGQCGRLASFVFRTP